MTYNYVIRDGGPFVLDVLWSLAIEMQFYLLLPFFLLLFFTRRARLIATGLVFIGIGFVVRPAFIHSYALAADDWLAVRFSTHCRMDTLAAGVFVYAVMCDPVVKQWIVTQSRIVIWGLTFICIMVLLLIPALTPFSYSHDKGLSVMAVAGSILVLVAAAADAPIIPVAAFRTFLRYVGERSFSLYLLHRLTSIMFLAAFPTITAGFQIMGGTGLFCRALESISILALTFICAELMYRLVEVPAVRTGHSYAKRLIPMKAAVAA